MRANIIACSADHRPEHSRRSSSVEDALAATLGAALVATARPADMELRNELLASALGLLNHAGHGLNLQRTAAVKQLIDVVGDRDSSNERIRQGAIATFLHVSSQQGAHR